MKKLALVLFVVALVGVLVGCSDDPVTKQQTTSVSSQPKSYNPSSTPTPTPSVAMPENVAVSKLKTSFTPAPDCDGGECYSVEFTVAIQLEGETRIRTAVVKEESFSYGKGDAKKDDKVVEATNLHKTLSSVDPKKLIVTFIGDEVIRISTGGEMLGKSYTPAEVLWQKKTY